MGVMIMLQVFVRGIAVSVGSFTTVIWARHTMLSLQLGIEGIVYREQTTAAKETMHFIFA